MKLESLTFLSSLVLMLKPLIWLLSFLVFLLVMPVYSMLRSDSTAIPLSFLMITVLPLTLSFPLRPILITSIKILVTNFMTILSSGFSPLVLPSGFLVWLKTLPLLVLLRILNIPNLVLLRIQNTL